MPGKLATVDKSKAALELMVSALADPNGQRPEWMTDAEWTALRSHLESTASAARVMARAAMSGRLDSFALIGLTQRARSALLAAAPLVAMKALDIALLGEEAAGGDSKMVSTLLKGLGLLTDSKPVDDADRNRATVVAAEVSGMTRSELSERVLKRVRSQQNNKDGD